MIKKITLLVFLSLLGYTSFSQGEVVGPIMSNPDLYNKSPKSNQLKADQTFDSTFIYYSDTLGMPFFDEFSKNHFQTYNANFGDPGVTSQEFFRILDNVTLVPIANDLYFTAQHTFRRIYDVETSTYIDEVFVPTQYKVGDLSSYPVNYATTDLYPPYYIYDTVGVPDVSDTVWIVGPEFYQDSATQFFKDINDPNAYWLDDNAYHNYRFAVEPRSLGVVTFDGLSSNGYPYQIGTTITNYADFLTSKPLDLSTYTDADSVYFSFLYQKQGFGDAPEASDSLVLEFYAKDLDQWKWVWSTNGGGLTDFEVGHIRLSNPDYFKDGFQFRFKNYGAMSGGLDHFHIDYVHLRALSGYQDTLFKDFAFVYPIGSALKTYTSVPWDHFKNNSTGKMTDALNLVVHNGSNLPENNQNGTVQIFYNSVLEGSFITNGQTLSGGQINYAPRTTYSSYHDLSGGYVFDITKTGDIQTFDLLATAAAQFPNLAQNDSTTGIQHFSNYYSYDDGSAEAAYGVTGTQARLAVKYTAYEADSLIGVNMHFVPSVSNVSNKLFLVTVWANNGGVPGAVIYEDEVFFPRTPVYGSERNQFVTYYFKDTMKVAVGTDYFIGWRQFDADALNIGLDNNLVNNDKIYYSVNGGISWNQSSVQGTLMIRPVYSTAIDSQLVVEETNFEENEVLIYPNPTTDMIRIQTKMNFDELTLFNFVGQQMLTSKEKEISLSHLPSGIYFIKVSGSERLFKIIKE